MTIPFISIALVAKKDIRCGDMLMLEKDGRVSPFKKGKVPIGFAPRDYEKGEEVQVVEKLDFIDL
jgi:hypothetical protein